MPRVRVCLCASIRATGWGLYPSESATERIRAVVSALNLAGLLKAIETVDLDTPASVATSLMRTRTGRFCCTLPACEHPAATRATGLARRWSKLSNRFIEPVRRDFSTA